MKKKKIVNSSRLATVLLMFTLLAGTLWAAPFPIDNTVYVIQGDGTNLSYLTKIDFTKDPWEFIRIPDDTTTYSGRINNLGFLKVNATEGYLYGWSISGALGSQLVRIDDTFVPVGIGRAGIPTGVDNLNAGDVYGNTMYLTNSGGAGSGAINDLYVVNLNTLSTTQIDITGYNGRVNDFAYNPFDNFLYGGNQETYEITRLDPSTGVRTDITSTNILPANSNLRYGGAWFDASGTLYLYENTQGKIYPITGLSGTPTLGTIINGNSSVDVDAASTVVPIPPSALLLGSGLLGMGLLGWRRKRG